MKRNAFRLWNVLSPNPDEAGWLLMNFSASAVSGWRARNACILAGSGLPVLGVRLGRKHVFVKGFGRAEREHRQMDHRGSPQLAVRQGELEPQAAHGGRRVGRVGLAAPQREAAENRHTAGLEDTRFREPNAVSVALEETGDANALGMIATETGVDTADFLETVGEPRGRQRIRGEPTAEIGEGPGDPCKSDADQRQSCRRAGRAERRPRVWWCFMADRHVFSFSMRPAVKECDRQRVSGTRILTENVDAVFRFIFSWL